METKEFVKPTDEEAKVKMNIAPELFETWKLFRQNGDVNLMVNEFKVSRPVIDNALLRGYVIKEGLIDKINKFFERRIKDQQQAAKRLLAMFQGAKQPAQPDEQAGR